MQNKTAILERLKFFEKTLKNLRNVFVSLNFFFFEHLHHFVIKQEFQTADKVLALLVFSGKPTTLLDVPIKSSDSRPKLTMLSAILTRNTQNMLKLYRSRRANTESTSIPRLSCNSD